MIQKIKRFAYQAALESFLFGSKWLLIPFYLGLMAAMAAYMFVNIKEVWHMIAHIGVLNKESSMLFVLELVDMTMIAALVKMIITGNYTSSVNKNHGQNNDKASSGTLKVKMSTSMVGVSSIYLLQKFISPVELSWDSLWKLIAIHIVMLLGSLILAWIEIIHVRSEKLESEIEADEEDRHERKNELAQKKVKHNNILNYNKPTHENSPIH